MTTGHTGRALTPRQRLETAWSFREPDRVPIELALDVAVAADPRSARVRALIATYCDRFVSWSPGWGFLGLPVEEEVQVVQEVPGRGVRQRRVRHTPAGDFVAITWHPVSTVDYRWEQQYLRDPDDLRRLLHYRDGLPEADPAGFFAARGRVGDQALLVVSIPHPFGILSRAALREDFFSWLHLERTLMHDLLSALVDRVVERLRPLLAAGVGPYFFQSGMELAIPPWMSRQMFEEYITPYDTKIYRLIHQYGGKTRIHCHGKIMGYLQRFVEIGIDGVEPCEPPPQGDVLLGEAKRLVGDRMLLCGNIPSPQFQFLHPDETEELVKQAIRAAAPGGGFILRTTGGEAGTWGGGNTERVLANVERLIEAGVRYGQYPISV